MAEDEIRKHANKAIKIMADKESDWRHKLKDIVIEILIIVFAVTISIWFHNWSDKLQEQKEEKAFLAGYRTDLATDIVHIQASLEFYQNSFKGMRYFAQVGKGDSLNNDSLKKYETIFFSSTSLDAHTSRYEALKSSGKLGIIENMELLNDIIDLNESTLIRIQLLNDMYAKFLGKTGDYIQQNIDLSPDFRFTNAAKVLRNSQWRFLMNYGQGLLIGNMIPAQQAGLEKCKALLQEIDKQEK